MKLVLRDTRGVSLPLAVSMLVVLTIAAATAYQLVLEALSSASQIESSSRAFYAAEAGVEDALYELSGHSSGYETPDLQSGSERSMDLSAAQGPRWEGRWEIKSMEPSGIFSGELKAKSKLMTHFFQDTSNPPLAEGSINAEAKNNQALNFSSQFSVTFRVPFDEAAGYSDFFTSQGTSLTIDNDGDLGAGNGAGPEAVDGLNEDGAANSALCDGVTLVKDGDCDEKEDEDSPEDPVVYWRLYDDTGRSLTPLEGCLTGAGTAEDPAGSELCEKDFEFNIATQKIELTLSESTEGLDNVTGSPVSIGEFIAPEYLGRPLEAEVHGEFLIVAPLKQVSGTGIAKEIPFLEYTVETDPVISRAGIPLPYFTIKSDGWYRNFKQSVTTLVYPKESVPLLDITLIQQQ